MDSTDHLKLGHVKKVKIEEPGLDGGSELNKPAESEGTNIALFLLTVSGVVVVELTNE